MLWRYHNIPFEWRKDPVPYSGKKYNSWNFGNVYRRPRTTNEKRWNCGYDEFVRGRRKPHALPNAWDDVVRSDFYCSKSWKLQKKKKQWM